MHHACSLIPVEQSAEFAAQAAELFGMSKVCDLWELFFGLG